MSHYHRVALRNRRSFTGHYAMGVFCTEYLSMSKPCKSVSVAGGLLITQDLKIFALGSCAACPCLMVTAQYLYVHRRPSS